MKKKLLRGIQIALSISAASVIVCLNLFSKLGMSVLMPASIAIGWVVAISLRGIQNEIEKIQ